LAGLQSTTRMDGHLAQEVFGQPKVANESGSNRTFSIEAWFETDGSVRTGKVIDMDPTRKVTKINELDAAKAD